MLYIRFFIMTTLFVIFTSFFAVYADGKKVITLGVASNFKKVIPSIMEEYLKVKGLKADDVDVKYIVASSGVLVTQMLNGLPVDIFLSADEEHVNDLMARNSSLVLNKSLYAVGRLALVTDSGKSYSDLTSCKFDSLVVANPTLAPYGAATAKFLTANKIDCPKAHNIVAESISATGSYVGKGVDFIFMSDSMAIDFLKLQKDNPDKYKKFAVLDMEKLAKVKPDAVLQYMAIVNKDYLDFVDFIHTNKKVYEILNSYGYGVGK